MSDQGAIREPAITEELKYLHQRVAELEKIAARHKQVEAVEKQQRRSAELATMLEVIRPTNRGVVATIRFKISDQPAKER